MKVSELRKLINEEVRKVVKEAKLISKANSSGEGGTPIDPTKDIKSGDYVYWFDIERKGGYDPSRGTVDSNTGKWMLAKVDKIKGSDLEVTVTYPNVSAGDVYSVDVKQDKVCRLPRVGEVAVSRADMDSGFDGYYIFTVTTVNPKSTKGIMSFTKYRVGDKTKKTKKEIFNLSDLRDKDGKLVFNLYKPGTTF